VRGHELIIRATDLFVKGEVRRPAQTAALGVLMKNATEEKGVIADMRAQEERLFRGRASQRNQHIGDILAAAFLIHVRRLHSTDARKSFQERGDIIAQLSIRDPDVAQDVTGQDIKIEVGRDPELTGAGKNFFHQAGRIQDGIAGFRIAEQIDQGNLIGLRAGQRSHDKVEISRRKARPTIRLDHRERIMSIGDAAWQED
jgi:hypothetical protein